MFGWGVVDGLNNRSLLLKKYTAYVQSTAACANHYVNITSSYHICTHSNSSQSYKGDSGAPALYTIRPTKGIHCGESVGHNETTKEAKNGEIPNCTPTSVLHLNDVNDEIKRRLEINESGLIQTGEYDCYVNDNRTGACLGNADSDFLLDSDTNTASLESDGIIHRSRTQPAQEMSFRGKSNKTARLPEASTRQCGHSIYVVASSRYTHFSCNDSSMCFTSNNRTCAKMKALCCTRIINLDVRCFRNGTLRHQATTLGQIVHNRRENSDTYPINTSNANSLDSVQTNRSPREEFLEENFVCSLDNKENQLKPEPENNGQKIVIGITSFHLDTYVILTNITDQYYRFIQDVISMT